RMPEITLQYMDQPHNKVRDDYDSDEYYAARLFPIAPVMKQSGLYSVYGKEKFRQYETIRHAGAEAREVAPWTLSNSAYFCDDHSLKDKISDEERANSDGVDLEINTTENLTNAVLLDHEIRVANLVLGGAVSNTTLSGTSQWSDYVNSDPISPVAAQK